MDGWTDRQMDKLNSIELCQHSSYYSKNGKSNLRQTIQEMQGPVNYACWVIFYAFVVVCRLFSKLTFQEHYQSVKGFGSRSGPTFCRS